MKKAVILFSGGLDSTTCLAYAKQQGYDCHAVSFDYGQRHSAEINAAINIAAQFGVSDHKIIKLNMADWGGSALTDPTIAINNHSGDKQIPSTYVPARNTVFLSLALSYAEAIQARDIFIGVSSVDYSGYPDCRPEYIAAFQQLANLATKDGVEHHAWQIHTPLIQLSKAATIQLGLSLDVDYSATVSCYRLSADRLACGLCDSCALRQRGFTELGIADPTRYQPVFQA